jgi:hypothetical protein
MADNPLKKKVGPLEVWQYVTIGTAAGLMYWLYKKKTSESKEVNPEEEEKLLGALDKGAGGGGSGGGEGSGTGTGQIGVPGSPGPAGEAGIAGPAGISGPQGEAPSAGLEAKVSALEEDVVKNQPPTSSHTGAPQALPKGEFRNAQNGGIERTFTKAGQIYHEYVKAGKGVKKGTIYKVGTVHKPATKSKRTKAPTPVHKKVAAKHVPVKPKKKEPVHR